MLIVTDNDNATADTSHAVTATLPEVHVGDLDGASQRGGATWNASVTVAIHDRTHVAVAGASVSGSWSTGGTASCTTAANGQCALSASIPNRTASVTFTVTNVSYSGSVYRPANNHDPEADSNGTAITLTR